LLALVIASFASLPLKWRAFFTAEAATARWNSWPASRRPNLAAPFLRKTAGRRSRRWRCRRSAPAGGDRRPGAGAAGGRPLRPARARRHALLLNVLRSIPELVWASLLLVAAGLGPFAGTLALAAHTAACWAACSPTRWKTPSRCRSKACAPTAPRR
jgi:phosphonate transport system permease protein